MHSDEEASFAGAAAGQKALEGKILQTWKRQKSRAIQQKNVTRVAEKTAVKAVKTGFIQTAAGKITAIVAAVCVTGGAFYGGMQWKEHNSRKSETFQERDQRKTEGVSELTTESEAAPLPVPTVENSQELDFSQFMEGGLNKAELLYVLAYGPKNIPEQGFTEESLVFIMNSLCQGTNENREPYFSALGWDEQSRGIYAAADVNRYISSFTDFQYPGDTVALALSTLNYVESAELYQTKFTSLGGKIELSLSVL